MKGAANWYKRYLGWFRKHKVITGIIVLVVFVIAVTSGGNSNNQNTADNQAASTDSSQQQTNTDTSQPASSAPTASSQSSTTQTAPAKPQLRQDLAFQGDATYCDGIYKDNGNGTTTWSYDVKKNGELITHLSDNNGQTYRHDVQITNAPNYYSYTAPVAIKDVAEIDGVLTVPGDSNGHPCNLNPQQQPQQAY